MTAEPAKKFEALEAQARKLMSVFLAAGHEAVAPAMIQPADIFLDAIGEGLRARTYVFTDPDGDELCLRPDLTVPTCRLHMERCADAATPAKYCYNGPAFRFQPMGAGAAHPREFRQAGIESFGAREREAAEAETITLILEALRAAGLEGWRLKIGDLGMFRAVLDDAEMPERWRQRLRHHFWRRGAFRAELARLSSDPASAVGHIPQALRSALDPDKPDEAPGILAAYMSREGLEPVGVRPVEEIAESLLSAIADARAKPLKAASARLIEDYLTIAAPAKAALAKVRGLVGGGGRNSSPALETLHNRLDLLAARGIDLDRVELVTEFGRNLEYYTGMVFEVQAPGFDAASPIAGGGRYDTLLKDVGAPVDVPAIGAAIHTERLLAAVQGGLP